MLPRCYIFITFFVFYSQVFAQGYYDSIYAKPRIFSADIQYVSYNDILSDSNGTPITIPTTFNFNLNSRFYRVYSLTMSYGKNTNFSYAGLGLRVDLPGFWFLSGIANDFVRRKKNRNANTYFHASKLLVQEAELSKYVDDRIGFGVDIFAIGDMYLNFEINLQSHRSNQYFTPAIGIGYEF